MASIIPLVLGALAGTAAYANYQRVKGAWQDAYGPDGELARKARKKRSKQERGHTTPAQKKVRRDIREDLKRDREVAEFEQLFGSMERAKRKAPKGKRRPTKKAQGGLVTNFKGTF